MDDQDEDSELDEMCLRSQVRRESMIHKPDFPLNADRCLEFHCDECEGAEMCSDRSSICCSPPDLHESVHCDLLIDRLIFLLDGAAKVLYNHKMILLTLA